MELSIYDLLKTINNPINREIYKNHTFQIDEDTFIHIDNDNHAILNTNNKSIALTDVNMISVNLKSNDIETKKKRRIKRQKDLEHFLKRARPSTYGMLKDLVNDLNKIYKTDYTVTEIRNDFKGRLSYLKPDFKKNVRIAFMNRLNHLIETYHPNDVKQLFNIYKNIYGDTDIFNRRITRYSIKNSIIFDKSKKGDNILAYDIDF